MSRVDRGVRLCLAGGVAVLVIIIPIGLFGIFGCGFAQCVRGTGRVRLPIVFLGVDGWRDGRRIILTSVLFYSLADIWS